MKSWAFEKINGRTLLYNQCWEDPLVDHAALEITSNDRIVMITSAGCNALDYLLKGPRRVDCVDINPYQTALLELKLAAIEALSHDEFFAMFGRGKIERHRDIYLSCLRPLLSQESKHIWDSRIDYFKPDGPGLYFHGASGVVARWFRWYFGRRREMAQKLEFLQTIRDMDLQADFYRRFVAPELWSPTVRWMLRRSFTMSFFGVPKEQIHQIESTTSQDLSQFIQAKVDRVFTSTLIAENYFWRVYMNGSYSPECCPNYLRKENFEILRKHRSRVHAHTSSVAEFLAAHAGPFNIYVLLDHMDWLTNAPLVLNDEWRQILRTAQIGARIIYRSGGITFDHIPEFAHKRLEMHRDKARELHQRDRVGTYGSFHLASVTA